MRYYYDTEFLEDGRTIELISIGIIADDGREYYAVNSSVGEDPLRGRIFRHPWLMENVVPHLPLSKRISRGQVSGSYHFELDTSSLLVLPKWVIANQVREFLLGGDTPPELWAWYGAYDHICLCQLWGPMERLPDGIPMYTCDIEQVARSRVPCPKPTHQDEHNALADARWNRDYLAMLEMAEERAQGQRD